MSASSRRRMSGTVLLLVIATGTLSLAGGRQASRAPALSRADAIADLDALFDALDRIHPAPYFNRSRERVMADRRQLTDTLPANQREILQRIRQFPGGVVVDEDRHLIVTSTDLATGISRGDRILRRRDARTRSSQARCAS